MSDAGQITVELVAKLDQLNAGLGEAVSAIRGATSEMRDSMRGVGEGGDELREKTERALDAGIFLEYEELAKQALEVVSEAFEKTAGRAMEFGLQTSKFAAMMGSSTEHAAGLEAALNSVGVSLNEYELLAMRMEMRLKNQEGAFQAMGMATRDANGDLLQGEALMQSAISTMQQYKTGTDQNEFALQIFGRRAQDIYDIMRANQVEQEAYLEDMRALGVVTEDTGHASVEMEAAIGRQKQQWVDLQIAIGQRLMPIITEFFGFLNTTGRPILQGIEIVILVVIDAVAALGTIFLEVGTAIGGAVAEVINVVSHLALVLYDLSSMNWGRLKSDFRDAMADIESTFTRTVERMGSIAGGFADIQKQLFGGGKSPGEEENPFAKGGEKRFVPFNQNASKENQQLQDEILQGIEKRALEEIKIEEQKNESLLKLGKQTEEQYLANAVELEEKKFAVEQEYLGKKLEADRAAERAAPAGTQGDSARASARLAQQKDMDQMQLLALQHQQALAAIDEKGAEQAMHLSQQETQQFIQDDNARLQNSIAAIEQDYQLHLLTDDEKADAERNLTTTIYGEELRRLDAELDTLTKGTQAWNQAYKERQKIAQEQSKAIQKINNDQVKEGMKDWLTLANSVRSSFNGAINGMITGTMTWQKAVGSIIDSIVNGFLQMGEKMVEDWAQTQLEKAILTKTTEATTAGGQIQAAAGVAAANAFASTAAIPVVGPELAPGAAAAAMSTVMSFQSLAFAEQGMLLDRDRLVFAHKDEQILPANISKGMQNLIANGGGGKGDTNLHYAPTVNAPQSRSLNQMLSDESSTMLSWLSARMRDGSFRPG